MRHDRDLGALETCKPKGIGNKTTYQHHPYHIGKEVMGEPAKQINHTPKANVCGS